jgi:hypothetical protein
VASRYNVAIAVDTIFWEGLTPLSLGRIILCSCLWKNNIQYNSTSSDRGRYLFTGIDGIGTCGFLLWVFGISC